MTMTLTLTITADDPADLLAQLQGLGALAAHAPASAVPAQTPSTEEVASATPAKAAKPRLVENGPARPVGRPPKPQQPPQSQPQTPAITENELRKVLTEYMKIYDHTATAELIAQHGHAEKLSKIDPKYYPAVHAAAMAALETAGNGSAA